MRKNSKSALENQIFWIYALIAFSNSSNKKACYIGQTINLNRRLHEHYKNNRIGKSSYYLYSWAKKENSIVKCIILCNTKTNQQKASVLENYWFGLARKNGYETPNSDVWANSKNSENFVGDYQFWPEEQINTKLVELENVVKLGFQIKSLE